VLIPLEVFVDGVNGQPAGDLPANVSKSPSAASVVLLLDSAGEAPDVLDQVRVLRLVRVGGPVQLDGLFG
jgi:hypothetical protein